MKNNPEHTLPISTQEKKAFLEKPAAYPGEPEQVEVKETHHSWVFLTEKHVYKLKKPVSNEYYDYTTVENRHANCRDELRLNRRLAEEIYLDVIPLTEEQGQLQLNGEGRVIDWLVKMKRLPAENMLEQSIEEGTVTHAEIERAAERLAEFYTHAPAEGLSYEAHRERLETEIAKCHEVLAFSGFELDTPLVEEARQDMEGFLSDASPLFRRRTEEGRIIEGHGDLRPEHICLRPKPLFIDCLEFSKELRVLDPIDDLAYLEVECDLLNVSWIGKRFFDIYSSISETPFPETLKYFYKALNAFVKARLSASHLLETKYQDDEKWIEKTNTCLEEVQKNIRLFKDCSY